MICYHGGPMSGPEQNALVWRGRDAMVSFYHPAQAEIAFEVCRTVMLDNGAFSAWKAGRPITNWLPYYGWVDHWRKHPAFACAIIPDAIDGSESDNDELLAGWPFPHAGVPVWHLHESLERLARLSSEYPTVALGSSGVFSAVGDRAWWGRMSEVMATVCGADGFPRCKLHGLRMLDPTVLAHLPLHSADSTNAARNMAIDKRWMGTYQPASTATRALIIMERIESHATAVRWCGSAGVQRNFELMDYAN